MNQFYEYMDQPLFMTAVWIVALLLCSAMAYDSGKKTEAMNAASLYVRISVLKAIADSYMPRHNLKTNRWHCPRTGEFVDNDDVTTDVILENECRKRETAERIQSAMASGNFKK